MSKLENLLLSYQAKGIKYLNVKSNSNYDFKKIFVNFDENILKNTDLLSQNNNSGDNLKKKSNSDKILKFKDTISSKNNISLKTSRNENF